MFDSCSMFIGFNRVNTVGPEVVIAETVTNSEVKIILKYAI